MSKTEFFLNLLFLIVFSFEYNSAVYSAQYGLSYGKQRRSGRPLPTNDAFYGPVASKPLPLPPKRAAIAKGSIDDYFKEIDRQLAAEEMAKQRKKAMFRSLLLKDGSVEDHIGDTPDQPLQTASPDIPPDVIAYFERSRRNDLALAESVQQIENDKIQREKYFKTNKLKARRLDPDSGGHPPANYNSGNENVVNVSKPRSSKRKWNKKI